MALDMMIQFWSDLSPLAWLGLKSLQVTGFVLILSVILAFLILMDRNLLKFVFKEIIIPAGSDKVLFILAPIITLVMAFVAWAVVPIAPGWVMSDINIGVLYILAISSLGVYGIIIGGWASNSKYPFMGALRSAAQMISYEVSIGFIILTVIFLTGSMNLSEIVNAQAGGFWQWHMFMLDFSKPLSLVLFPIMFYMGVMFFISALAETNRPPFDLPEAESELVAGFMVEYSSTPYLLFMFGEYLNMTLMCAMFTILFLGGWHAPIDIGVQFIPPIFWFTLKCLVMFFMFAMVKAIVPRYRYDQLMRLGWKVFLPTSLAAVVFVSTWVVFFGDKI